MSKLTKNQKLVADKIEAGKAYSLKEASQLVKVPYWRSASWWAPSPDEGKHPSGYP